MTTARERARWVSRGIEALLIGAVAAVLVVILLPTVRRGRERARRSAWIEDVRSGFEGARSAAARSAFRRSSGAYPESLLRLDAVEPELASWGNIGGCGVGGGGGDVRWIGRRSPGGRVETEFLISYAAGEDLQTTKYTFRVSGDLPGRFNVGLQLPYLHSLRRDENYFVDPDEQMVVDSWGDLSLLVSRKFGMLGATSANLTIGFPTAPHDLEYDGWFPIAYDAQPGRGEYTFSLGAEHTIDRDMGPVIFGGSYSYNGGENDVGDYKASTISGFGYFSYKTASLVHSLGANLTFALGKDRAGQFGEIPDQATTLVSLQYGLEFQLPGMYRAPLYFSCIETLSERGHEVYTLALGIVTSF